MPTLPPNHEPEPEPKPGENGDGKTGSIWSVIADFFTGWFK
jgi:hypothetical protein